MGISPHIFRAYDIRGTYDSEVSAEVFLQIGRGLGVIGREKGWKRAVVGCDIRKTSGVLVNALIAGMLDAGLDVTDVGVSTFGMCAFAGWKLGKDFIAFVTASHLPPEWNGLKLYYGNGIAFSENDLNALRDVVLSSHESPLSDSRSHNTSQKSRNASRKSGNAAIGAEAAVSSEHGGKWMSVGDFHRVEMRNEYVEYLASQFDCRDFGGRVVIDCGNGCMGIVAFDVMRKAGVENVDAIFAQPDFRFPNRPAEPTAENLSALCNEVLRKNADFGVAFDGDGDRVVFVDDRGRVLSAEEAGVVVAREMLSAGEGSKKGNKKHASEKRAKDAPVEASVKAAAEEKPIVLANVECSMLIEAELSRFAVVRRVPVGHTSLTREASRQNAVFGVESSGHFVIPAIFPFDDAMLMPLKMAEVLANTGEKLSKMVDELPKFHKKRENIRCPDEVKFEVMHVLEKRLIAEFGEDKVDLTDGIRIADSGWVLIRASNTEPLIRITSEAESEEKMQNQLNEFLRRTKEVIRDLTS